MIAVEQSFQRNLKERLSDIEYDSLKTAYETMLVMTALLLSFVLATTFVLGRDDLHKCDLWFLGLHNQTNERLKITTNPNFKTFPYWEDRKGSPFSKSKADVEGLPSTFLQSHLILYRSTMSIGAYMGCLLLFTTLFLSLTLSNAQKSNNEPKEKTKLYFMDWWFPWGFSGTMLAIALFFIAFVQGTRSIDDIIACVFPGIKAAAVFPAPSLSVEEHVGEYVAQGMVNFPTYIGLGFGCLVGFIGFTRTKMINAETMKIPEPKDDGTTNMSNQELIAAIFKQNQLIVQYMQQQHRNGDGKNGTPPPPPHLGNNTQIIPMSEGYNSTDKTEVENLRAIRLEHGADSEEYRQAANNLHE